MAVRDRNLAGPVTALRATVILGIKGDKGDPGTLGAVPGTGVVIDTAGTLSVINDGAANQIFGMSAGGVKQYQTVSGDATMTGGALALAATGVTPGTYGDATHVPAVTVDAKGRITAASSVPVTATFTSTFVYQPGGAAAGNVYTSWSLLVAAVNAVAGIKTVLIDASFVGGNAHVPAGSWSVDNWNICGSTGTDGSVQTLTFDSGATLTFNTLWFQRLIVNSASAGAIVTFNAGHGGCIYWLEVELLSPTAPFFHFTGTTGPITWLGVQENMLGDGVAPVIQVDSPAEVEIQLSNHSILFANATSGTGILDVECDCDTILQTPQMAGIAYFPKGFAPLVNYTPATPANWAAPPALVQTALDDLALPSGVTPGTYGDATHVSQVAVDAHGKVTSASNVAIAAGGVTSVSGGTGINSSGGTTPSISLQVPVTVPDGGTGLTTLTAHDLLVGNGTGNVLLLAPGASGNVVTSNGTDWVSSAPAAAVGTLAFTAFNTAAIGGGALTGSNTFQDQISVAFTTTQANQQVQFFSMGSTNYLTPSPTGTSVALNLDGSNVFFADVAIPGSEIRESWSVVWAQTVTSAGAHTAKIQMGDPAAAGGGNVNNLSLLVNGYTH
jgi:hypothetical protein